MSPTNVTTNELSTLRDQLALLVSRLDTSHVLKPDSVDEALGASGPVCVYVSSPEHYGGDVTAEEVGAARRIAMAILAACDRAEGLAYGGVTYVSAPREVTR